MDHHGKMSHLEGVAIRAYRDHYGERRNKPRFVVTGFPDEDATFAIAALAGLLPHPSLASKFPNAPEDLQPVLGQNLLQIAKLIDQVDRNPDFAITLEDSSEGMHLLAFRQQGNPTSQDVVAWYGGVDRWRAILTTQSPEFLFAAVQSQDEKLEDVKNAPHEVITDNEIVVVDLSAFGPNSRYYQEWFKDYPIVVAFLGGARGWGRCTFVVKDYKTAQKYFGYRGLSSVYPLLQPGGCGGRGIIGGSSRSVPISWKKAIHYGYQIADVVSQRKGKTSDSEQWPWWRDAY
jgi:hypothetical protein